MGKLTSIKVTYDTRYTLHVNNSHYFVFKNKNIDFVSYRVVGALH